MIIIVIIITTTIIGENSLSYLKSTPSNSTKY